MNNACDLQMPLLKQEHIMKRNGAHEVEKVEIWT
jgi:hypothetical protein